MKNMTIFEVFNAGLQIKNNSYKVAFFRKYDAFFSLPKKCAENYPEKEILKLRSV